MKDEIRRENGRDLKSNKDKGRNRSPRRDRSRSPADRRNKSDQSNKAQRRVYVANISFDTHWREVKDLFREKIGNVSYCTLFENEEGRSRGCGLVEFTDAASARKAIDELGRFEFKGRELVVKEDIDCERDRFGRIITRKDKDNRSNNNNQQREVDRHNRSIYDPMRQTYSNSYATYGLSPQFLEALNITGPLNNRIFVANLDYKVGEKKLEEIFRLAGKVLRVRLYSDQNGTSKGFGTVEFEHPVEAVQAISMFNNINLYNRAMSIRMDKYEIEEMPEVLPSKLPNGLETIGKGLGVGGQPLNISKSLNSQVVTNTANPAPQPTLMGNVQNTSLPTGLGQNQGLSAPASQSQVNSFNMSGLGNSSLGQQVALNSSALSSPQVNQALNSAANLSSLNLSGLNTSSLSGLGNAANLSQLSNAQNMNNLLAGLASNPSSLNTSLGFNTTGSAPQNNQLYGSYDQRDFQQDRFRNGALLNPLGNTNQQPGTDKVYIRNLPHSYNWQNLKDRFSEIGEVKYTEVKKNGLATVQFSQPRDAARAVDLMNGLRIENRVIEVGFA